MMMVSLDENPFVDVEMLAVSFFTHLATFLFPTCSLHVLFQTRLISKL